MSFMILKFFRTVTWPMRCWAFQQYCVIVIHLLVQAVVISWWLMRDKKGRSFGIRLYSFLFQILGESRICFVPWVNLIYLLNVDRPLSHILKVQIHIRWNSFSSRPRNQVPFHLREFLCVLYLNFSYFFRYILTCWALCGRCDCFGIQGYASKTAVVVCWWMSACVSGWECGELQLGAGRPLTVAFVAQVACVRALLETNKQ